MVPGSSRATQRPYKALRTWYCIQSGWNVPRATVHDILDRYLNTIHVPRFEAVASKGIGVFDTLKAISKLVISKL